MRLREFAPEELSDERLIELVQEYIELSHSITAVMAQSDSWWEDDEDGSKQYIWEEMKHARQQMLDTFPFLVHITPNTPKWRQ